MKRLFTFLAISVSFLLFSQNPTCDGSRYLNNDFTLDSTMGVVFGNSTTIGGTNADLLMDIYEPAGDVAAHRPVMLVAFGGSFIGGDRSQMHYMCRYFAQKGYVVASIDYRLYDGPLFPVPDSIIMTDEVIKAVSDMRAAVRFFKEDAWNADTYRIDTNLIFVGGVSAGGIVASHVGLMDSTDVVDNFVDSLIQTNGGWQGNSSSNTQYTENVHGILNFSGALKNANYIDASNPPIFSVHDDGDGVVPYAGGFASVFSFPIVYMNGSYLMDQQAQNVGVNSELITIAGSNGHVSYFDNQVGQDSILNRSKEFLYPIVCAGSLSLTEEELNTSFFNVYPNPTNSILNISSTNYFDFYQIEIIDLQGRKVYSKESLKGNQSIDLSNFEKGSYLVKIQSDKLEVKRIVLE